MKVVNLSRRPFTNRRPVLRLAMLFWILGGLLLLVNAWLYGSHFSGSSKGRGRLDALARQVNQEQDRLNELWVELQSLNLDERNRKARYLNALIHTRTFPWSALFDDLEETLPIDVYLGAVQPSLRLAEQPTVKASAQPRRARTAREARERARGGASAQAVNAVEEEEDFFSGDRVGLTIRGFARNDEALFEFVDRLYQDPSFSDPNLAREATDKTGKVSFNVKVVYLTPKRNAKPPEEGSPGAGIAVASGEFQEGGGSGVGNQPTPGRIGEEGGGSGVSGELIADQNVVPGRSANRRNTTNQSSRSRARNVRRGKPQRRAGLPPEEGEELADSGVGRRSRSGSRSTDPRNPSTVSVAPGFIPSAPGVVGQNPTGQNPGTQNPGTQNPGRPVVNNPGEGGGGNGRNPTTQPSNPGGGGGNDSGGGGDGGPGTNPIPTTPSASSSPRLQGTLFDSWIPDFLRWIPDDSGFSEWNEEVAG